MYGLLGSLRVLRVPGGGTFTFHAPFVGAAMVLGGPTAGAWVAFLSTLELRELETQPWYGILANHAVLVTGAVLGAVTTRVVGLLLPAGKGLRQWERENAKGTGKSTTEAQRHGEGHGMRK